METAPLFTDIAAGPEGGAAHWLTTSDGVRIRVGHWHAENAKGTIIFFPGRTEYVEKYGRTARDFVARGYTTVSIDWRGQGLSDRSHPNKALGHVEDYKDYQRDVAAVMAYVAELELPKPYFSIAHSMGGTIALRALIEGLDVKACGFSAPMWGVHGSSPLLAYAWFVATLARIFGFTNRIVPGQFEETYVLRAPFEGNTLTGDEENFAILQDMARAHPELKLGGPTLAWLGTALREMKRLASLPSPDVPCVTFLGTEESIVDPGRIKRRMANWPNGQLHIVQGGRHEMLVDKPEVRDTLINGYSALFDPFCSDT